MTPLCRAAGVLVQEEIPEQVKVRLGAEIVAAIEGAVLVEREACARLAECRPEDTPYYHLGGPAIAAAIRARGKIVAEVVDATYCYPLRPGQKPPDIPGVH